MVTIWYHHLPDFRTLAFRRKTLSSSAPVETRLPRLSLFPTDDAPPLAAAIIVVVGRGRDGNEPLLPCTAK